AANAASRGHSRRSGGWDRAQSSVKDASTAATSERPAVTNSGSKSATARRVAGSVRPKMVTPRRPRSRAWRLRADVRSADMGGLLARSCDWFSGVEVVSAAVAAEHLARDDDAHDLVGAFQDLVHPQVPYQLLEAIVVEVAVAAVHLQRVVDDLEAELRGK